VRIPGPAPRGPRVTLVWSTPRRELVVERSGRVRLGWASVAFVAATGLPDAEAGDAQALNRVTLRLMQAWGTVRIAAELLRHRYGWANAEHNESA
jgi:hypothetical protein